MTEPLSRQALAGRIGAHERWSRASSEDRRAQGRRGQAGLREKFLREIDPAGTLSEQERDRRWESKRKAIMADLTMRRVMARRARKAGESEDRVAAPPMSAA